ncbi:MAG: aspartate/glutamate racemase family protein [Acidobacteriota bacterium]
MRTLGLVGGTGWVSTIEYYRLINEDVNRRLGGLEAAKILLHSFNYGDINRLNATEDHRGVLALVEEAALGLERSGAECLVLCANTLHLYADELQTKLSRPILHIAAATAESIRGRGLARVGLLGTRFTMEKDFYTRRLGEAGLQVLVPGEADRAFIHGAIYGELLKGRFLPETRARMLDVIEGLRERGAEGVVLGCTEIPLLVRPEHVDLPLFDTLAIHARAAADFALSGDGG